jgi:hypothetical protein
MKVARLSGLCTGHLYPLLISVRGWVSSRSVAGRIIAVKNSKDMVGIEPAIF